MKRATQKKRRHRRHWDSQLYMYMDFEARMYSGCHNLNIDKDSDSPTALAMNDGKFRIITSCLFLKAILWIGMMGYTSLLKNNLCNLGRYVVFLLQFGKWGKQVDELLTSGFNVFVSSVDHFWPRGRGKINLAWHAYLHHSTVIIWCCLKAYFGGHCVLEWHETRTGGMSKNFQKQINQIKSADLWRCEMHI